MLNSCSSRTAAAVLAALLIAAPARAQDAHVRVDSIFSFATPDVPGCAVGVSRHGQRIVDRAYGLADVEHRTALTPATLFDIGSVQKQFVAAAILLLSQDGRLALGDDVRKHVPELFDYGHTITIDHLLTHTSGLRDWVGLLPMAGEGTDVLQLILRQRGLNFVPGTEWSYSNSGYVLLKEIVARAGGMTFAEFARTRLFEPLGMTTTAYVEDILQGAGERALAYEKEGSGWRLYMRLGNERGGGAIISNAGELLIWNDALANGRLGGLVTAKLHEHARLTNGRKLTYARGLMVSDVPEGTLISHSGGAAGYSTWLGRLPEHGLSLAVLCNFEPVSASSLAGRVADLFLPPVDQDAAPRRVAAPGVDVTARAGLYFDTRTGEPLRLVVNSGRLSIATGPPLVPVTAEQYRPSRASLFYRSEDDFELTFRSNDEFELKSMEGETSLYGRAQPWTPTAADLQSVAGRYHSNDLGPVFEILPGSDRLIWRFEAEPDKAVEMEPVAPDTYMRSMQIVRFRRDANGSVTALDFSSPALRGVRLTRVGDLAASTPAVRAAREAAPAGQAPSPPATATTPAAAAPPLEQLVGEYEMAPGRSLTITLEQGQLFGEPAGNPKRALVHVSGATFAVGRADAPVTVTFTLGDDGRAAAMVMRQHGSERTLPRVR